jgi:hypothetical protein
VYNVSASDVCPTHFLFGNKASERYYFDTPDTGSVILFRIYGIDRRNKSRQLLGYSIIDPYIRKKSATSPTKGKNAEDDDDSEEDQPVAKKSEAICVRSGGFQLPIYAKELSTNLPLSSGTFAKFRRYLTSNRF